MTLMWIILFVVLLCGVGFFPAPAFTTQHRTILGTVLLVIFLFWLLKFSQYHVF